MLPAAPYIVPHRVMFWGIGIFLLTFLYITLAGVRARNQKNIPSINGKPLAKGAKNALDALPAPAKRGTSTHAHMPCSFGITGFISFIAAYSMLSPLKVHPPVTRPFR